MKNEIWKVIPNTNGEYYASNLGRIKSLPRRVKFGNRFRLTKETILKQRDNGNGYKVVQIHNQPQYVHRLVAMAFIKNDEELLEVNHKDEDKSNNCVDNLEWCDRKYNANYGTIRKRIHNKLSERYKVINLDTGAIYDSPMDASRKTGIHNDGISRVCKGKAKTAGGFRWRYLNE